jgi:hypothetical protein
MPQFKNITDVREIFVDNERWMEMVKNVSIDEVQYERCFDVPWTLVPQVRFKTNEIL